MIRFLLAGIALSLALMKAADPYLCLYWILVCAYWTTNLIDWRMNKHD